MRTPTPNRSVERLAAEISDLRESMRSLQTQPQLGWSSLDDAALKLYIDGLLRGYLGKLPDGSGGLLPVNAPPPPKPNAPTAVGVPGGIMVRWDATFAGGETVDPETGEVLNADGELAEPIMPMDFTRVEVHVSLTTPFTADSFDTLVTTIESPRGGEVFVRVDDEATRYVALVARNTSGSKSLQSDIITVTALPHQVNTPTSHYGETPPADPVENHLWWKQPGNKPHIWNGSQWVAITDQAAIDAAEAAAAAQTSANGKNRIYYTSAAPAGTAHVLDDIWFDTANGYRVSRWNGTAWILSELGHQAIGSLDMGKATVGLLNARFIGTGVLVAGQTLKAGGHDSGGNLLAYGGRVELNDTGLKLISRVNGADTTTVHLNTASGAGYFKGEIAADYGYFRGRLEAGEGWFKGDLTGANMYLTGTLTVSGLIRSAASGGRVELGQAVGFTDALRFYNSGGSNYGEISAGGRTGTGRLEIWGHTDSLNPYSSWVTFYPSNSQLNAEANFGGSVAADRFLVKQGSSRVDLTPNWPDLVVEGYRVLTDRNHSHGTPPIVYKGNYLGTTDASGIIAIPHGMGFTPAAATLTLGVSSATANAMPKLRGSTPMDSSNLYVQVVNSSGGNVTGTQARIYWVAVG